ncbi:unnamed protein product [Euphydryas editha]|uniref:Uncharacterized protein n=1 Tax=Euphydryas editha TaxID=104508 RepID=A0AAU9U1E0_EUPED|nr:unnamed protein product [Euphydryas editha]
MLAGSLKFMKMSTKRTLIESALYSQLREQSLLSKLSQFDELKPTGMAKVMMINGIQFTIRFTKCRIMCGLNDRKSKTRYYKVAEIFLKLFDYSEYQNQYGDNKLLSPC